MAMSELQVIEGALERAARRRRWARALRGMWLGLLVGAVAWLLALGIFKLAPISASILLWSGLGALVCPLAGLLLGGWRKPALPETARWVDLRQNLKERLSTALEVAGKHDGGIWCDLVVADAASQAKQLDPRQLVPFRLSKATRWAMLVLALAAGLGFVPEYRSKKFLQQQADKQNIREVGKQLADLTRRDLQKRPPALEPTKTAMETVANLGDEFTKKASLTRSEALKDLANVTDKLKDELKDLNKDPGLKRLEQAARAPGGNSQTAEGLQKQMEAVQKQMGNQNGNPEAMNKLKDDLAKLQEAAKSLADKTGAGSDAERQKLSESLAALSKQAQDLGVQLPQLDDAIAALAANQTDLFLKDLNAAMTDLEKTRDMAKTLQQLQAQAEKLGKDLAEQLKNGQAEAAQSTLQKMVDQLKSANLAPEQLQKMLQEVSKAVDPASPYGKVADFLKQATGQMQSGNKPGAAQSLAAAAKELEKLQQQLGDAQSLMATLDALKQASMCVGTGQCWGMGKGNRPGIGRGGKPGSGVGTWADENGGWGYDGQWTERWDNSGVVRPDMDPRGITERDASLSDALLPTKVKGQFSPGGQMPSITLKGVSIKGQSKVAYEESVTAAQADAQSALSQEKVPRAYQGAVRDYFDDLKK